MGGEWMEIGFSFHFEEVDGGRMEDDSPSNQAKIGQLVRRKEGLWVCHRGQPNLPTSRPYVLNPCRYTRTSPERVQNESRTKIKIKMMNRNVSEAPSQRIIVIVSHPLTVGLVGNRIAMLLELRKGCGIRTTCRTDHKVECHSAGGSCRDNTS